MNPESNAPRPTFWSKVTWPRQEGILLFVWCPIGCFVFGFCYGGLLNGLIFGAVIVGLVLVLWPIHRILKAWAEWPVQHRGMQWLKAAIRYCLTDDG